MIGEDRQKLYDPLSETVKSYKECKHVWDDPADRKTEKTNQPVPHRSLKQKLHDWLKKKICGCDAAEGRREKPIPEPEGYVPPNMYL